MTNSILQSFLDNRFIKTDNPEHIENLKKASNAVQKLLEKKKQKIMSYTLVAFDPTISNDDPVVVEVESLMVKKWPTFHNSVAKTKDKPIVYIQAIILDALNAISKDDILAAIIWHTGCNIVNHYKLAGQKEVLTSFLMTIEKKVEVVARKSWSILGDVKTYTIDPIELTLPAVNQGKIDKGQFEIHLKAAAVHNGWASQAGGGENPFMPAQNNWNWPKFFAERAAEGLSKEINTVLSSHNKSITSIAKSIQESINTFFANLKPQLEQISSSILQSSKSLYKRSDLLWWKQALYSLRLNSSYRTLDPLTLAFAMAIDLANNVSPIHPKSVDFFLKETLRDVQGSKSDEKIAIIELLEQLQQLPNDEKQLLEDFYDENEGRKSLGACMADMVKEKINADEFYSRTGLEKSTSISWEELTVWLFHDFQANTLAYMK